MITRIKSDVDVLLQYWASCLKVYKSKWIIILPQSFFKN